MMRKFMMMAIVLVMAVSVSGCWIPWHEDGWGGRHHHDGGHDRGGGRGGRR